MDQGRDVNISTAGMPPHLAASTIEAVGRLNAYSYFADGIFLGDTPSTLRRDVNARTRQARRGWPDAPPAPWWVRLAAGLGLAPAAGAPPDIGVELGRVAWRRGASALDLRGAAGAFRGALPPDYLAFMAGADGGEGWVGADGDYLILFPLRDLVGLNRAYQVDVFAPGLVVIGSSGGGEAFAFDTRRSPPPVVAVPWVEMTLDLAAPVAPSFAGLLAALAAGWEVPDLG